jgi:hypothetical protein
LSETGGPYLNGKTSWSSERVIIEPAYAFVSSLSRATRSCSSFTLLMRYSNSPRFSGSQQWATACPGQCGDGELLLLAEDGTNGSSVPKAAWLKNRYKAEVAAPVALARHNQTETLPAVTITATATKKTPFPSSSSVVLFAQMMFAD